MLIDARAEGCSPASAGLLQEGLPPRQQPRRLHQNKDITLSKVSQTSKAIFICFSNLNLEFVSRNDVLSTAFKDGSLSLWANSVCTFNYLLQAFIV